MVTFAEANRRYFDSVYEEYDSKPWFQKTNDQIRDTLRGDLPWIGVPLCHTSDTPHTKETRLLDYACGTGLMTRVFGPYVSKTLGMDVSPNMVKTYNERAALGQIPEDVVYATVGDLLDKSNPNPPEFSNAEWNNFDIAAVGLAFHHFEDPTFAAGQFRQRLRPGGVIVLTDFLEGGDMLADDEGNPIPGSQGNHAPHHDHDHGHGHSGSEKEHKHHHPSNLLHHHHDHKASEDDEKRETLMKHSFVKPHFTVDGVKQFLINAGFVDVDVHTLEEKSYMEFGGKKMFRTLLFARGRNPS